MGDALGRAQIGTGHDDVDVAERLRNVDFALVDPALCPWARRSPSGASSRPLNFDRLQETSSQAESVVPFLIPIHRALPQRKAQLNNLTEWALETNGVTWIESALGAAALVLSLSARTGLVASDEQVALLRLADARVLPAVVRVLDDVEREAFLWPVSAWWYFDREETLQRLDGGSSTGADPWTAPWTMKAAQEAELMAQAEPDTVLALLQAHFPDDLQRLPRASRHGFVLAQCEAAREHRIDASADVAVICMMAMKVGDDPTAEAAWAERLAKIYDKSLDLMQAVAEMETYIG